MFYSNLHRYLLAAALAMLVISGTAVARGLPADVRGALPDYYPASFQQTGVIRNTGGNNQLTVSGNRYGLSSNVLVHSLATEHDSRYALHVGAEMGFSFDHDAQGNRRITEIWILPAGTIRLD